MQIPGTGSNRLWSNDDVGLVRSVRAELQKGPDDGQADMRPLIARLRAQRMEPLAEALGSTASGLPTARSLIVLPSTDMAGIPLEILLADDDPRTVSYAPSATIFRSLRERPRPDRHAGLLAVGDSIYERPAKPNDADLPDHGVVINVVEPGSNAATRGLKRGDVLLSYNGVALQTART